MTIAFLIVAILGVLVCAPPCFQALGFDVRIGRRKPMTSEPIAATASKGKWILVLCISLIALVAAGFGLYKAIRPSTIEKTIEKPVDVPYKFAFQDHQPSKQVIGKIFRKERVYLDDTTFLDCQFIDVTFVYNGTAPFQMERGSITPGYVIASDNPGINDFAALLYILKATNIPMIDAATGKPPVNIEPVKPRRPQ